MPWKSGCPSGVRGTVQGFAEFVFTAGERACPGIARGADNIAASAIALLIKRDVNLWRFILSNITQLLQTNSAVPAKLGLPVQFEGHPLHRESVTTPILRLAKRQNPNLFTIAILVLFHLGAIAALFMFEWRLLWISLGLYWMTVGLGISMGYHRLHTHRSYRVPLLLEYFFAVCGTLTLEGGPIFWVAPHRTTHPTAARP